MGSDLRLKNSHNKIVSHPAKHKDAKVSYDFTKPISFLGRYSEGGHFTYYYNPDGVLAVCNVEENTCSIMEDTDNNGKFDTGTIFSIDESSKKYKITSQEKFDEKEHDVETVARNSLAGLQQQNKKSHLPKINIDGKIGHFSQYRTGDCGLLGGLLGLSFPLIGAKIIKKSISQDEKGVHVKLEGIDESFDVLPEEIIDEDELSWGDHDVRAIELAIKKDTIKSLIHSLELSKMADNSLKIDVNELNEGLKDPLRGTSLRSIFLFFTKNHTEDIYSTNWKLEKYPNKSPAWRKIDIEEDKKAKENRQKAQEILDNKMIHPDRFALAASIIISEDIPNPHGVGIKRVDKEHVIYVNPWDSSKEIKVTRKEFIENYFELASCDLKTRRSKEEDNFAR